MKKFAFSNGRFSTITAWNDFVRFFHYNVLPNDICDRITVIVNLGIKIEIAQSDILVFFDNSVFVLNAKKYLRLTYKIL